MPKTCAEPILQRDMTPTPVIRINRAPVLTLWASIVARRSGYGEEEALTLGRAIAGLTAQSKGRRLGIYAPGSEASRKRVITQREEMGAGSVAFMGRELPCVRTELGLRALSGGSPIEPESVRAYLSSRFKDHLSVVEAQLTALATTFDPAELETRAMDLYMRFRPEVPKGEAGWGRMGLLDLDKVAGLAEEGRAAG